MSYHIYSTKGIILSERPTREADRIYTILTRELGLVHATALGVRKEASKLRGNIEPFSIASLSFVKGKDYWRLTSAESIKIIFPSTFILRPFSLIEKLVQGEQAHPELFDVVEKFALSQELQDEKFEIGLASQILFHLGYLKAEDLSLEKKAMIRAINDGIQASHLT